jgi:hypothetical protein
MCDFGQLRFPEMLHSADCLLVTDVSEQPIGFILKRQSVQEYETDQLSRNFVNNQSALCNTLKD